MAIAYRNGDSIATLATKYHLGKGVINRVLIDHAVEKRPFHGKRIYQIDHRAFASFTNESLYFAAMLITDGNVFYPARGQAAICLSIADRDVVENLRNFIKTTRPIGTRIKPTAHHKTLYNLYFQSNQIASDLERYGVVPRKSLIAQVPEEHEDEIIYSRYWVRALLEGDGSYWYKIQEGKLYPTITFTSGSLNLAEQYKKSIVKNGFDIARNKIKIDRRGPTYSVVVCGTKAVAILDWLYADAEPCLRMDRKHSLALEMIAGKYKYVSELKNKQKEVMPNEKAENLARDE